jgi:hypothetical protein
MSRFIFICLLFDAVHEIRHRRRAGPCWLSCARQRSEGYHRSDRRNSGGIDLKLVNFYALQHQNIALFQAHCKFYVAMQHYRCA